MAELTPEQLFEVLERSGLLAPSDLARVRWYLERPERPGAVKIAQWLVKKNYVTIWQAERLLGGNTTFFLAGVYQFIDQIAEGAMGVVFKATHTVMGRTVAVKVLSKARLSHPNAVARFHREVQAMAALGHPNIVTAFDAGQIGRTYYLVMEYIDGTDLNDWLEKYDRLPIPWACEFIRQAALGLDHAHQQGMVHRDIKPANLMVAWNEDEKRPVVKVLDLGLATAFGDMVDEIDAARDTLRDAVHEAIRQSEASHTEGNALDDASGGVLRDAEGNAEDDAFDEFSDTQLTQAGTILGTPDYLAPEQVLRLDSVDARADVFALGCTLFKLLTGHLPYSGPDLMGKLEARVSPTAPPAVRLRTLRSDADEELESIVAKMLERDPDRRYRTAAEVALALAPFAEAPREGWHEVRPAHLTNRDSGEVGSTQMKADPKLREFFGGLKRETNPALGTDEVPVIHAQTRSIAADGTHSISASDSGNVLDGEEPLDASGSSLMLEEFRRKQERTRLAVVVVLGLLALAGLGVLWYVVTLPPPKPANPWPGDRRELVLAWRSGFGTRVMTWEKVLSRPEMELELIGAVPIDPAGRLDLTLPGSVRIEAAESALVAACKRTGEMTLELVFSVDDSAQLDQSGEPPLVTFSSGRHDRNFALVQNGEDLAIYLRSTSASMAEPTRLCTIPSAGWHHLVVAIGNDELRWFLDGDAAGEAIDVDVDFAGWLPKSLLLGKEADGSGDWHGKIERIAIFSRAVGEDEARNRYQMVRPRL